MAVHHCAASAKGAARGRGQARYFGGVQDVARSGDDRCRKGLLTQRALAAS